MGRLCILGAVLLAALGAGGPWCQQPTARPTLSILEPTPDTILTGSVELKASVTGDAAVKTVEFYVDGTLACVVEQPPYSCSFDAGSATSARLVRVVVSFLDGPDRIVKTVQSRGLGVTETASTEAVLVPAVVTDWQNRFVKNLPASAFHILENGVPQPITFVKSEGVPVDVVLAIDISASMASSMPKLKQAVKAFVRGISPKEHVTVLAFNDRTYVVSKQDSPVGATEAAIDKLEAYGGTSIYDAILQALDLLGHDISRKAIIVFTDGNDQDSLSSAERVEEHLRESDATVYMITQGLGSQAEEVRRVVDRLAQVTGGRAFPTEKIDQLQKALAWVLDDLTHQYLIGYAPTNTAHDGSYRKIAVSVNDRSDEVRARDGYRAMGKSQ